MKKSKKNRDGKLIIVAISMIALASIFTIISVYGILSTNKSVKAHRVTKTYHGSVKNIVTSEDDKGNKQYNLVISTQQGTFKLNRTSHDDDSMLASSSDENNADKLVYKLKKHDTLTFKLEGFKDNNKIVQPRFASLKVTSGQPDTMNKNNIKINQLFK